jgi:hypothetical protein
MKIKILFILISLLTILFIGCGSNEKSNYIGYWQGEDNLIFEVLSTGNNKYTIRNINGDLQASIENDVLTGKNSLDMPFSMKVKGDSAYYQFGTIITGYKRIDKTAYDAIYKTQTSVVP